jgi:hypothetical protein
VDFLPAPEAASLGVDRVEKAVYELVFDIDLYTKKQIAVSSFDPKSWLHGWNKVIVRDADTFLGLAGGSMSNVVRLSTYLRPLDAMGDTSLPVEGRSEWVIDRPRHSDGSLSAGALQRLNPEAHLSRFLALASNAVAQLEVSKESLAVGDALRADDVLMGTKSILSELLMYRDLSDSIGLIVFKAFQATSAVKAITDTPSSRHRRHHRRGPRFRRECRRRPHQAERPVLEGGEIE